MNKAEILLSRRADPKLGRHFGVAALVAAVSIGPALVAGVLGDATAHSQALEHPVGFAAIVAKVKPAVTSVRVKIDAGPLNDLNSPFSDETPLERFLRRFGVPNDTPERSPGPSDRDFVTGQGSGFFISADGYAVTNGHVVSQAKSVEVTTDSGKTHTARVIGLDSRSDIALIKVDGGTFPFVAFADKVPQVGDWVLAIGNPFGLGGTVTAGIVSARGRDIGAGPYDDFIQIDAPVNRGNSGGPTFDVDGNVIGVNTAIVSPSGGSVGIAFAIPAETVKGVVTQLKEKGKVSRGWIGVQIQQVTQEIADSLGLKEAHGALVSEPQPDGPAAKAGIKSGDVTAVNGKEISDAHDLARTISGMPPGTPVKLSVIRAGEEKTFTITLGALPDQREANAAPKLFQPKSTSVAQLGLSVTPQPGGGIAISKVEPDGLAAERGLKTGDVIIEAGGRQVAAAADLQNAIEAARKAGRRSLLLQIKSGNATRFVAVPVGRG